MPEKTADKVQEDTRRYMREADDVAQDAFRMGNDFITTTINYYFDSFGRIMHDTMEIANKTQPMTEDIMSTYRRFYMDGVKNWQDYMASINKIIIRPTK
jgi:hypothetical protein